MKETKRTVKLCELVEDFDFYPRCSVDGQHVGFMVVALKGGAVLPPIIVDQDLRVIDGFHRRRAMIRLYGPDHQVEVIARVYKGKDDRLKDSALLNASHGRTLTTQDRVRCLHLAAKMRVPMAEMAEVLHMEVKAMIELKKGRTATSKRTGDPLPLKGSIKHMAGQELTESQEDVLDSLPGMPVSLLIKQLTDLLREDLIDRSDAKLAKKLEVLRDELDRYLGGAAAAAVKVK